MLGALFNVTVVLQVSVCPGTKLNVCVGLVKLAVTGTSIELSIILVNRVVPKVVGFTCGQYGCVAKVSDPSVVWSARTVLVNVNVPSPSSGLFVIVTGALPLVTFPTKSSAVAVAEDEGVFQYTSPVVLVQLLTVPL